MSLHAVSPSPPRTPLRTLDIHANGAYTPTPSPLYATAKTSRSKPLRRKPSLQTFRSHFDDPESSPSSNSPHSQFEDALFMPHSLVDNMLLLTEMEREREERRRNWRETSPKMDDFTLGHGGDLALLTPTPKTRTTPLINRSASPPALLLHDGLFSTPPKSTTHYPHVLEAITERTSVATLRTSLSTLRQPSLQLSVPLPVQAPVSPPARLSSSSLSSVARSSISLPTPRPYTPEVPSPPPRVPTPLIHSTFQKPPTMKFSRLPASPQRPPDDFLSPAGGTVAERQLRTHLARPPQKNVMYGHEERRSALLPKTRFKAVGRIPDGHYHPWNMLARRRLQQQQQQGSSEEEEVRERERTGARTRMGMGREGWDVERQVRRRDDAERRARTEKEIVYLGALVVGTKARGRRDRAWDKVRGKLGWICCGVERVGDEREEDANEDANEQVRGRRGW